MLIQDWQNRTQISVAAEVDAALLGDDLPLNAYSDAGFVEFLKAPPERMRRAAMTPAPSLSQPRLAASVAGRAAGSSASLALLACGAHARAGRPSAAAGAAAARARKASAGQASTPAQREALAPLEHEWPGIDAPRKQKWIALAARFQTLPPRRAQPASRSA